MVRSGGRAVPAPSRRSARSRTHPHRAGLAGTCWHPHCPSTSRWPPPWQTLRAVRGCVAPAVREHVPTARPSGAARVHRPNRGSPTSAANGTVPRRYGTRVASRHESRRPAAGRASPFGRIRRYGDPRTAARPPGTRTEVWTWTAPGLLRSRTEMARSERVGWTGPTARGQGNCPVVADRRLQEAMVASTAASGQPPHASDKYARFGPPPLSCTEHATTRSASSLPLFRRLRAAAPAGPTGAAVALGPARPCRRRTSGRRPLFRRAACWP